MVTISHDDGSLGKIYQRKIENLLSALDPSGDGAVDFDEFKQFINRRDKALRESRNFRSYAPRSRTNSSSSTTRRRSRPSSTPCIRRKRCVSAFPNSIIEANI